MYEQSLFAWNPCFKFSVWKLDEGDGSTPGAPSPLLFSRLFPSSLGGRKPRMMVSESGVTECNVDHEEWFVVYKFTSLGS